MDREGIADLDTGRRVRAGDVTAWDALWRRYDGALACLVARMLPLSADRIDALQETWFQAYRSASNYDPLRPAFPWLAKICAHVCLRQARARRRLMDRSRALAEHLRGDSAPSNADAQAARASVREALEGLSRREREVIRLRYLNGLSAREVAEVLDVAPKTIDTTVTRALLKLRRGPLAVDLRESFNTLCQGA